MSNKGTIISRIKGSQCHSYQRGVHNFQTYQSQMTLASSKSANNQMKKSILTTDIYVYARKRPKLESEEKFDDMIQVGNENNSNASSLNNRFATLSICINEIKNAVDGTPILRKVNS
jgi:arabinogalactan endo-1,4-beta-galactosidase